MNNKPGFIPIIIAVVVAAVLVGGVTYGVTSSKRNKVIKDQNAKIEELIQEVEGLKTQLSAEALSLSEEVSEIPSILSTPSVPSVPKPSTPSAKPATPATPATPAAPAQPSNMKTWSGEIYSDREGKNYSISFQYPSDLQVVKESKDRLRVGDVQIYIDPFAIWTNLTSEAIASHIKTMNKDMAPSISASDVKILMIGGKSSGQYKLTNTYIHLGSTTNLFVTAPSSAEVVYNQILSSMKF